MNDKITSIAWSMDHEAMHNNYEHFSRRQRIEDPAIARCAHEFSAKLISLRCENEWTVNVNRFISSPNGICIIHIHSHRIDSRYTSTYCRIALLQRRMLLHKFHFNIDILTAHSSFSFSFATSSPSNLSSSFHPTSLIKNADERGGDKEAQKEIIYV